MEKKQKQHEEWNFFKINPFLKNMAFSFPNNNPIPLSKKKKKHPIENIFFLKISLFLMIHKNRKIREEEEVSDVD